MKIDPPLKENRKEKSSPNGFKKSAKTNKTSLGERELSKIIYPAGPSYNSVRFCIRSCSKNADNIEKGIVRKKIEFRKS